MAIPNTRPAQAPPPLPPPRDLTDLTAGSDPGWAWGNDPSGKFGKAGGSLAHTRNFPKSWSKGIGEDMQAQSPERPQHLRRDQPGATMKSPRDADRRHHDFARHQDEGYYSLPGPGTSAMSQQLHGERQLQQRNTENSSQTYDNKLLSKLGKPKTPPRTSSISSLESSPTSSLPFHPSGRHPNQLRSLSFPHSSNNVYSNSAYSETPPIKKEPSDYDDSPQLRSMSPGLLYSGNPNSFKSWRSPTYERSTTTSIAESEEYPQYPQRFPSSSAVLRQQKSRRSTSGSLLSSYDESAGKVTANTVIEHASRLKRESYDQSMFSETDSADSTFPMEDSVRHLKLEDHPPLSSHSESNPFCYPPSHPSLHTSRSRPGMERKRKPSESPPPPKLSHEANANAQLLAAAGMNYRNTSQHPAQRLSPVHRFAPNQGSISSQSSAGFRTNSYASSAGLSVGGSSITSLDQHSPGTISPSSDHPQHYQPHNDQDSPYIATLPMNQGPRNTRSQPPQQYPQPPLENPPDPSVDQKPQMNPVQRRNNGPNMQSSAFICQCCPKKPKKFDTEQELRNHESEKQYSCQYCNNRFKNKNEAERHQNSLHLRKHSWSCATLNAQYDSAFYPATQIPSSDNNAAQQPPPSTNQLVAFDTCGYCGEQFPNDPRPDWEARAAHLTNVHKFGECNQSKKFFRADHFRQHLKHSHAGTSGKWTNLLEQACMKEEPNPTPQDTSQPQGAPVANMGMGQPVNQANMGQQNMSQNVGQQNIGQANMANMGQPNIIQQQGFGQANMGQQNMTPASMAHQAQQAQQMAQMDMSNIDPSIGLQPVGALATMGNMTSIPPSPGQGMNMQGGQIRNERMDEVPQEM